MVNTATGPSRPPTSLELLERAIAYTRGSLLLVTEADLDRPTPCREWALLDLLRHMDDSLLAFAEAAQARTLSLVRADNDAVGSELIDTICRRACGLLSHWHPEPVGGVAVGGFTVPRELLGAAGALEITVHGWDVATALGADRPIPPGLAMDLWPVARDHVTDDDRPEPFGPALAVPAWASPQERLLAHAGRRA
jgi:uncharacterized protein (TIGR03086 family)